jgi:hypothetical protein
LRSLAAWQLSNCGELMGERAEVRADVTITGTAGGGVQSQLAGLARRLAAVHGDQLATRAVERCVWSCAEELLRAGVRCGLVPATEAMARARLARHPPDPSLIPGRLVCAATNSDPAR